MSTKWITTPPPYGQTVILALEHKDKFVRGADRQIVTTGARTHTDKEGEHYNYGAPKFSSDLGEIMTYNIVAWQPLPEFPTRAELENKEPMSYAASSTGTGPALP
jgi:hypothetical protein